MRSAIDGTVAEFDAWLKDGKLPFFTDYTDHGPEHLNHVLLTAAALIPEEAQEKIYSRGHRGFGSSSSST